MSWFHVCPGPTTIRMYFSIRKGSKIDVTVLDSNVLFVEGFTQTVTGDMSIDWTVKSPSGFTLSAPENARGAKFLYPRELRHDIKFILTPKVDFSALDFYDWESFLWTYDIFYNEIC